MKFSQITAIKLKIDNKNRTFTYVVICHNRLALAGNEIKINEIKETRTKKLDIITSMIRKNYKILNPKTFTTRSYEEKAFSTATKTDLENPIANGIGDALGVLLVVAGDDGEIGDDRLGIQRELREDNLVNPHNLVVGGGIVVVVATPEESLEAIEDRRRKGLRRRREH